MDNPNSTKFDLGEPRKGKVDKSTISETLNLIKTRAPQLRELNLKGQFPGITDRKNFWTSIPELKLRKIGIFLEKQRYSDPQEILYSREFLCELFAASPLLESLVLTSAYYSEKNECRILQWLAEAKNGELGNMLELEIGDADKKTIDLIAANFAEAPLQKLIFNSIRNEFDDQGFTKILENHKSTLKHFKFLFDSGYHDQIKFPEMNVLAKLEFGANHTGMGPEPFFVMETIQGNSFPNLVTLNLIDDIHYHDRKHSPPGTRLFDTEELFPEGGMPIWTLRNLRLPPVLTVKGLQRAGKLFPGVKRLVLGPQKAEVIQELWTTWTETMEILTISLKIDEFLPEDKKPTPEDESERSTFSNKLAAIHESLKPKSASYDSMITGLPDAFIQEIQENYKKDKRFPHLKVQTFFKDRRSISNFKKLTHLKIHDGSRPEVLIPRFQSPTKFTDISFQFGFGQLPNLEFLIISNGVVQVSQRVINEICENIGLLEVKNRVTVNLIKSETDAQKLFTGMGIAFPFDSIPEFVD